MTLCSSCYPCVNICNLCLCERASFLSRGVGLAAQQQQLPNECLMHHICIWHSCLVSVGPPESTKKGLGSMAMGDVDVAALCWRLKAVGAPKVSRLMASGNLKQVTPNVRALVPSRRLVHFKLCVVQAFILAVLLTTWMDFSSPDWQDCAVVCACEVWLSWISLWQCSVVLCAGQLQAILRRGVRGQSRSHEGFLGKGNAFGSPRHALYDELCGWW